MCDQGGADPHRDADPYPPGELKLERLEGYLVQLGKIEIEFV